jgi:hypothetical protein
VIDERCLEHLRPVVSAARAAATEALVVEQMQRLFGTERVLPQFEYPIGKGNWAECDVVVELPGSAIAVECKSGALDDEYRYGDLDYASSTLKTLVEHPFMQSARAASFLKAGPSKFRLKGESNTRVWPGTDAVTRIAVSLERIDPLVLVATRSKLPEDTGGPSWVVCLADFLMVTEVLSDAHSFFSYASLRAELAANPSLSVISEADLLGAFLHDRLRAVRRSLATDPGRIVSINNHAQELNAYYSAVALGVGPRPPKPRLKVARRDEARLDALWSDADPDWAAAAVAIVAPGWRRPR